MASTLSNYQLVVPFTPLQPLLLKRALHVPDVRSGRDRVQFLLGTYLMNLRNDRRRQNPALGALVGTRIAWRPPEIEYQSTHRCTGRPASGVALDSPTRSAMLGIFV